MEEMSGVAEHTRQVRSSNPSEKVAALDAKYSKGMDMNGNGGFGRLV